MNKIAIIGAFFAGVIVVSVTGACLPDNTETLPGYTRPCNASEAMAEDGSCVNLDYWDSLPTLVEPTPVIITPAVPSTDPTICN